MCEHHTAFRGLSASRNAKRLTTRFTARAMAVLTVLGSLALPVVSSAAGFHVDFPKPGSTLVRPGISVAGTCMSHEFDEVWVRVLPRDPRVVAVNAPVQAHLSSGLFFLPELTLPVGDSSIQVIGTRFDHLRKTVLIDGTTIRVRRTSFEAELGRSDLTEEIIPVEVYDLETVITDGRAIVHFVAMLDGTDGTELVTFNGVRAEYSDGLWRARILAPSGSLPVEIRVGRESGVIGRADVELYNPDRSAYEFAMGGQPSRVSGNRYLCLLDFELETIRRTVAGKLRAECGCATNLGDCVHTKPYGNWGVDSTYALRGDAYQFPGWYKSDGWRQWDSCTDDPGRVQESNYDESTYSFGSIPVGVTAYALGGKKLCEQLDGYVLQTDDELWLYELDAPGEDEGVGILTYKAIRSNPLAGCSYGGCPSAGHSRWHPQYAYFPGVYGASGGIAAKVRIRIKGASLVIQDPIGQRYPEAP